MTQRANAEADEQSLYHNATDLDDVHDTMAAQEQEAEEDFATSRDYVAPDTASANSSELESIDERATKSYARSSSIGIENEENTLPPFSHAERQSPSVHSQSTLRDLPSSALVQYRAIL